MKFKLFKSDGSASSETEVKNFPSLEEGKGVDALRQCVLAVRANNRQGNASTKTRDEVSGSGKKIYRQKGLGTGRAGDKRAIQRTGGGVAFGPKPRSYNQKVNGKVRKLALTRALIDQANDGSISLIEEWSVKTPKTKEFATLLQALGTESKTLIISDAIDQNLALATRNLPKVKVSKALEVNALDLVVADQVVCCVKGINSLISKL
jgi:large subunit ribosomal protein L4|tara:strand:- start:269 stop:889 length:621 start_codon:yes stop_codon:yes gene_type:complete